MKTTLIAATLALGFAIAAPAFAGEGRFGDNEIEAPNSQAVVQGANQATVSPGANRLYSFPGSVDSPISHGRD